MLLDYGDAAPGAGPDQAQTSALVNRGGPFSSFLLHRGVEGLEEQGEWEGLCVVT